MKKNKLIKKIKGSKHIIGYEKSKIMNNYIFLESKKGDDLAGNIFYLLNELQKEVYDSFKIFLVVTDYSKDKIEKLLCKYDIEKYNFVYAGTDKYCKILAKSKYLFNDTGFGADFIKKDGQIYTNTWHGTPFKALGKNVKNRRYAIGNIKRNFLMCDNLIYPNKEIEEKMLASYGLNNLYNGNILNVGYPRNSVLINAGNNSNIKKELDIENKKIFLYMPTWRGVMTEKENEKQCEEIRNYFIDIDKKMTKNELLYVKLHPFNKESLSLDGFNNIKYFPEEYETYDFLNIVDVLITDYSSVFIDFAITERKIILFTYDQDKYVEEHGLFYDINEMPFPIVNNVKDLISEMKDSKYSNYTNFIEKFNTYETSDSPKRLLDFVLYNDDSHKIAKKLKKEKKNILIYTGGLELNGITSSVKALLNEIDVNKYNLIVTFTTKSIKSNPNKLDTINDNVDFFPIVSVCNKTIKEILAYICYFRFNKSNAVVDKILSDMYKRNFKRVYGGVNFDLIIHYTGYEKDIVNLLNVSSTKKLIYVHNNMVEELKTKGNHHRLTLEKAYSKYDKVVVVTKEMSAPVIELGGTPENIIEINNFIDNKKIIEKSCEKINFDHSVYTEITVKKLEQILDDKSVKKFINIGRFSDEKGQERLIDAFEEYCENNSDAYLIIMGGYGKKFKQILNKVNTSFYNKRIILLKNVANPYPILKKCDLLILSSFYEALGLVLIEADILGVVCFSTDIPGTKEFLEEHNGNIVENSKEGILDGMIRYNSDFKLMNIDVSKINEKNLVKLYNEIGEDIKK